MLILVTMEAGPSVDEDGWSAFGLLAEAEHAVESAIRSMRSVFRHGRGFIVTVGHACVDS